MVRPNSYHTKQGMQTIALHPDAPLIQKMEADERAVGSMFTKTGGIDVTNCYDFRIGMIIVSAARKSNTQPTRLIPGIKGLKGPELGLPDLVPLKNRMIKAGLDIDQTNRIISHSVLSHVRFAGSCINDVPYSRRTDYKDKEITVQYAGICMFYNHTKDIIHVGDRLRLTIPSLSSDWVKSRTGVQNNDVDNANLTCAVFFGLEKVDAESLGHSYSEHFKDLLRLYFTNCREFLRIYQASRPLGVNTVSHVYNFVNSKAASGFLFSTAIGNRAHLVFAPKSRNRGIEMPDLLDIHRDFAPPDIESFPNDSLLKKRENGDATAYAIVLNYLSRRSNKLDGATEKDKEALNNVPDWKLRIDPHDSSKNARVRLFFYRQERRKALARPGHPFKQTVFVADPYDQSCVLSCLFNVIVGSSNPQTDRSYMGGLTSQALDQMRKTQDRIEQSRKIDGGGPSGSKIVPTDQENADIRLLDTVGDFMEGVLRFVCHGLIRISKDDEYGLRRRPGQAVESIARTKIGNNYDANVNTDLGQNLAVQDVTEERCLHVGFTAHDIFRSSVVGISAGICGPGEVGAYYALPAGA